jgi:hypothetical protein
VTHPKFEAADNRHLNSPLNWWWTSRNGKLLRSEAPRKVRNPLWR